jgi:outer membrane protein TolC
MYILNRHTKVLAADLYTRINFTGFYGGGSSRLEDLTTNHQLTWGVGPIISWSFPINAWLARASARPTWT